MLYETERLIIRKAILTDQIDIYNMLTDPVILKYNAIKPPTLDEVAQIIEKEKNENMHYAIELKENHRVIGEIKMGEDSLRYDTNSILISYHLNTEFVGKGYMSEALLGAIDYCFNVRHAEIIAARVFTPNERSNKLLKRLGFKLEGTLRHAVKAYQDVIYDDNLYGLTKSDYEALLKK